MLYRTLRVTRAGNVNLHLREWGEGEICIILLHGFGDGGYVWDATAPLLTVFGRVLALDFSGHGKSDWDPGGGYNLDLFASDVTEVIDQLQLEKLVLVGHSLGGRVAIRVTEQQRARLQGLVLVDTGPGLSREAGLTMRREFRECSQPFLRLEDYVGWLKSQRPYADEATLLHFAENSLEKCSDGTLRATCDPAIVGFTDGVDESMLWSLLKGISYPVLLVRGVASSILPAPLATRIVKSLSNGQLAIIGEAGHNVMLDNPGEFQLSLERFFCQLEADAVTELQWRRLPE